MAPHKKLAVGIVLGTLVAWGLCSPPLQAHFMLTSNLRVIHIEHRKDGLRLYIRLPTPLILADLVGPAWADRSAGPAPYTFDQIEGDQLLHYLDVEAVRRDPIGLGKLVVDRHALIADSRLLQGRVEAVRVYPAFEQSRFTNLQEARAALQGPPYPSRVETVSVGETVVDVQVFYPSPEPVTRYHAFGARTSPALKGVEGLANLLFDHRDGQTRVFRALGTLEEPIVVGYAGLAATTAVEGAQPWTEAVYAFVRQGILHIVNGTDHVLFVLCLTIGAFELSNLLWRVTGFTLGHTTTLIAGFFGFVPAMMWFIPAIEAGIALSIIYAGAVALLRRASGATLLVTAAIGLLHGFGFSFVLHKLLQVDAPHLWTSLLSFNLGVEIGQVALIFVVWPVLRLAERRAPRYTAYGRAAVVTPCVAVAALWTIEGITLVWARLML